MIRIKVICFLTGLTGLLLAKEAAAQPALHWTKQYGDTIWKEQGFANAKLNPNLYVHYGNIGSYSATSPAFSGPVVMFTDSLGDSLGTVRYANLPGAYGSGLAVRPDEQTFVLFGTSDDPSLPSYQPQNYLIKADAQGQEIWRKIFLNGRAHETTRVIALPDGYLLVGSAAPNAGTPIPRGTIIKTDLEGAIQWERGIAMNTQFDDAVLCRDGSLVAVGYKIPGGNTANMQHFLKRFSPAGEPVDSAEFGTPGLFERANRIIHTADGGYALAGFINVLNGTSPVRNGQLIKLDSAWNKQWEHRIVPGWGNYDGGCELQSVSEAINGEFIVAGAFIPNIFPHRHNAYLASIFNAQTAGVPIWSEQYGIGNTSNEFFADLLHEANGTGMLTGTRSYSTISDFYLTRVRNLPEPYIRDYCVTPPQARTYWQASGGVLAFRDSSTAGPNRAAVVKWEWNYGDGQSETLYDSTATYTWATRPKPVHTYASQWQNAATVGTLTVTNNLGCTSTVVFKPFDPLGRAETKEELAVNVYPNPASEAVKIELAKEQGPVQLSVRDALGREVVRQTLPAGGGMIQTGNWSKGLYFYQLIGSKGNRSGKLVIR